MLSNNINLEYYENTDYYIDNAINNWDAILGSVLSKVSSHKEGSDIMRYEEDYKNFLLANRNSIFLFNPLETFEQILSVCNFHHQYQLLSLYPLMCICNEHTINPFRPPYVCDIDNARLNFINTTRDNYDFLGFINRKEPCGKFVTATL